MEYIAMGWLVQPLLFFLARCTRNQLIRNIEFLKAENEILLKRYVRHHVVVSHEDRARLIKLGDAIGPDLKRLITIVRYDTYLRWVRRAKDLVPKKRGRARKPNEIRELVIKIAHETGWGYTRVLGELRKLGINDISRQTVVNILRDHGYEPNSRRGPGSWDELLKMHAETLWQCDFFSRRVFSRFGMPQLFAMVFLNLATRRVWISPATRNPTEAWVEEQAKAFIAHVDANDLRVDLVTRDNDQIYKHGFDRVMTEAGFRPRRLSLRSPNLNAYVERFIQSIQVECLDHFLIFGEKHFDYLVKEYVEHYHEERPHQGLENRLVTGESPHSGDGEIQCSMRLGGLLKHFHRSAA
jgi:putative transposase